jgi:hypothetical protein
LELSQNGRVAFYFSSSLQSIVNPASLTTIRRVRGLAFGRC